MNGLLASAGPAPQPPGLLPAERLLPPVARWGRLASWSALVLACVVAAQLLPRDLGWDQLNHHWYLGTYAGGERLARDFLAVGGQTYQVPYAYVPFAAMVNADWPPRLIVAVLAAVAGLNLILLFEIGVLLARARQVSIWPVAWGAALLGAVSPLFVQQLGTSGNDLPLAVLVLAGYWALLARAVAGPEAAGPARQDSAWVGAAGLALGVACGLKLSHAPLALAAVLMLPAGCSSWRQVVRRSVIFAGAGVAGTALAAGPWLLQLWREFGNPLFPAFNHIFCAPDWSCAAGGAADDRFLPAGVEGLLRRPFEMALPLRLIYAESAAPDLRLAAAALFAVPLLWWGWRRAPRAGAWLPAALLVAAVAVSCVLWLSLSGNGRYWMAGLLLLGPVLVAIFLSPGGIGRVFVYAGGLILLAQGTQLALSSDLRNGYARWGEQWYESHWPAEFAREPTLFLVATRPSPGFFLRHVHPDSTVIGISNIPVLRPDGPGGARISRALAEWRGPIVGIGWEGALAAPGALAPDSARLALSVARFGLGVDPASCRSLALEGAGGGAESAPSPAGAPAELPALTMRWPVCRLRPDPDLAARVRAVEQRAQPVFDWLERRCPHLFTPGAAGTEVLPTVAIRLYPARDLGVVVDEQTAVLIVMRLNIPIFLGAIADTASWTFDCRLPVRNVLARPVLPAASALPGGS